MTNRNGLAEFDQLCDAFTTNHVANRASRAQGRALLSAVERIFPERGSALVRATLRSPVLDYLQRLHQTCAAATEGDVATYIPELAKANPDWFGICLVTATGAIYEVGDSQQPFTIQSISKPFVYGLALEDNGRATVLEKVGMEPTGDAFNSISLEPGTGGRAIR